MKLTSRDKENKPVERELLLIEEVPACDSPRVQVLSLAILAPNELQNKYDSISLRVN